jgi:hypothetical protein
MSKVKTQAEQMTYDEYKRFSSLLEGIESFVKKHPILTYIEFDYYVVHDMTLFSIEPDFDFGHLDEMIKHMRKTMPAVKRIFNKPIIVLKDTDDVLPVENTRIINQNTLLHLANHSQNVANLTERGVKPRKLLTRIYEDDYSIYENAIFCNYIDDTLSWIKRNKRTLNSLLYASNIMRFNLLEKVNHVNYFLALGKLHTGYVRDFSQYFNLSKEMLHELDNISQTIQPRLHKAIYQKNTKRNKSLSLKKTNIFLSQKDYRQVYKTYKLLLGNRTKQKEAIESMDLEMLESHYLSYVQILTIFAAGHFNFEINPSARIDLTSLAVSCSFKSWKLDIFSNNKKEMILHFNKDKMYKMMIISTSSDNKSLNYYKKNYGVDEVVEVNQFEENYVDRNNVFISLEDIDSFRRIQQILLKGMIYADTKRDVCPFCGGKLHQDPHFGFYQCDSCMTQIKENTCTETKRKYYYTDNAHLKKYAISRSDFKKDDDWSYDKQVESQMYFRNISKINHQGDIICPICNKVHEDKSKSHM